jgi:hypothetical protein
MAEYTNVKYTAALNLETNVKETNGIRATLAGQEMFIPLVAGNAQYDDIMEQVEAGTLTIADAD